MTNNKQITEVLNNQSVFCLTVKHIFRKQERPFRDLSITETAFLVEKHLNGGGKCQYNPNSRLYDKQKSLYSVKYKSSNMSGGDKRDRTADRFGASRRNADCGGRN